MKPVKMHLALMVWVGCCVLSTAVAAGPSGFERLAGSVPEDAFLVIGTSGLAELQPILEQTLVGRLVQDPNVRTFVQPLIQQVLAQMPEDANDLQTVQTWLQRIETVARNPMLLALCKRNGPVDPNGFPLYGCLVLDCQGRRPAVEALLDQLEDTLKIREDFVEQTLAGITVQKKLVEDEDPPLYYGWVDSKLVIAVNDPNGQTIKAQQSPHSLPGALQAVPGHGDLYSLYLNWNRLMEFLTQAKDFDEDIDLPVWTMPLLEMLGLRDIQALVSRSGVEEKSLVMHEHLALSGARRGVFTLMKPADRRLFEAMDPCATEAVTWNWDLDGTLDLGIKAGTLVDANVPKWVDQGLEQARENTGVALRDKLLRNLAGPMAFYNIPPGAYPDLFMGGGVMMARLRDPNGFSTALEKLGTYIGTKSQGQLTIRTEDGDHGPIHIWTVKAMMMLQLMPTWTVVDDLWIVSTNIPLIKRAVQRLTDPELRAYSLAQTSAFKATTQKVPDGAFVIEYSDTRAQYAQMTQALQQFWPMAVMGAMQQGITLPMALPKLDHLLGDLHPACSYGVLNDRGLFNRLEGPQVQAYGVAGGAMGLGIIMPALARTRQLAERMTSGTQLSAIGKACLIYEADKGAFPANLGDLVADNYIEPKILKSRLCRSGEPGDDYLYIQGQTIHDDPQNVLAYDNPDKLIRPDEGANVLFLDTHVEFCKPDHLDEVLQATYKRLGDRAPQESKP